MRRTINIGDKTVGDGHPVYIIGEIGLNHNGSIDLAKQLIDLAKMAGCDAVKFQKRTPEICVPMDQRDKMRETPWGYKTYMDYRYKVEFEKTEYDEIDRYCKEKGIHWFASCWDEPSVDFISQYDIPCFKMASASLTDTDLLKHHRSKGLPIILSSGMSELSQIKSAIEAIGDEDLMLLHATSTYPCPPEELNLRMISTLRGMYDFPIGYSGHETGLPTTVASVALGANIIERHITLDRAMWGSDQAASVAPIGLIRLVKQIRQIEVAMGDGVKKVYESEIPIRAKLRRK
jgi:N-acetylneuraminate synthase